MSIPEVKGKTEGCPGQTCLSKGGSVDQNQILSLVQSDFDLHKPKRQLELRKVLTHYLGFPANLAIINQEERPFFFFVLIMGKR